MTPNDRLNKILAKLGYGSRRSVDALIESGRVYVNGQPATLGQRVVQADTVTIDNKTINLESPEPIVIAFNKPRGVVSTKSDPYAKVTLTDFLPSHLRHLFPVGRLDKESRGLILLTNDGDLALKLQHPRYEHEKEYKIAFKSLDRLTENAAIQKIRTLEHQIVDRDAQSKPITVRNPAFNGASQDGTATVILTEGKNRQIRRLLEAIGFTVTDLKRVRIGNVTLGDLREGETRRLDPKTVL